MSDLPEQGLFQQMHARRVSGEYLEVLGKKAAAGWVGGEHKTLTDAVVETVKQAHLSPEQVKRVVEFANTSAYLGEFRKEGTSHRVIDFEGGPADASAILKDLNDGGGGSVFDAGTSDYSLPPSSGHGTKTASSQVEEALMTAFGAERTPAELPFENPHAEVIDLRSKLAGASDHLNSQISALEVMYAELSDRTYHQVKQAALSGYSLGQVLHVWETVSPSDEYIKVAFSLMSPRLLREGVFHTVEAMTSSVDKVASAGSVNPEHPLVVEFGEFCEALSKLAELRAARVEVREQLGRLDAYLKTASTVGDLYGKASQGARGAADAIAPFVSKHLGETAGKATHIAVRNAPNLALLAAANEAHTHLKYDPSLQPVRSAGNMVLRQIPGTQQNLMHKYEVQSGQ